MTTKRSGRRALRTQANAITRSRIPLPDGVRQRCRERLLPHPDSTHKPVLRDAVPRRLTRADIRRLFELLDAELARSDVEGELYVVGGAVMCLAFDVREATRDVDALFRPAGLVRQAAARVAVKAGVPESWLNDAVKGYLSPRGAFDPYLELDHLRVFIAQPQYLLAMKCAAMRLGEEFHDLDDVRYLLRYLNVATVEEALTIVTRYFDEAQLPPKTRVALEELLPGQGRSS